MRGLPRRQRQSPPARKAVPVANPQLQAGCCCCHASSCAMSLVAASGHPFTMGNFPRAWTGNRRHPRALASVNSRGSAVTDAAPQHRQSATHTAGEKSTRRQIRTGCNRPLRTHARIVCGLTRSKSATSTESRAVRRSLCTSLSNTVFNGGARYLPAVVRACRL